MTSMHPDDLAINEYLDGTLDPGQRAEVESHLKGCDECRQTIDALSTVRRLAGGLKPMEPPSRAWTDIEHVLRERLSEKTSERGQQDPERAAAGWRRLLRFGSGSAGETAGSRWRWTGLAVVTAVALLAAVAGLLSGRFLNRGSAPQVAVAPSAPEPDTSDAAQSVEAELRQAEEHYQKAITGLEQIASAEKGTLDPTTAATLEKNLAVVDQAIGESRGALKAQPASELAQQSLLDNFKTKIALLQETVALINEMRKSDEDASDTAELPQPRG
jgi:anti-sigma factor ChrR (cupin superfamily)